jgi:hypothetical protein
MLFCQVDRPRAVIEIDCGVDHVFDAGIHGTPENFIAIGIELG